MAINRYNIRHWWLMLTGKSADHVNQNLGKSFKPGELAGYFNDLTNKVTIQKELLETDDVPLVCGMNDKDIEFPTAIFQYGLYDMIQVCDDAKYRDAYEKTIASPFYHNQSEALFLATGDAIYDEYAKRWKKFQKSKIKYMRAFVKKAMQKVTERF